MVTLIKGAARAIAAAVPWKAWAALGAVAALVVIYQLGALSGASQERSAAAARDAATAIETLERMNNADTSRGDPDSDREWLRERARGRYPGGR